MTFIFSSVCSVPKIVLIFKQSDLPQNLFNLPPPCSAVDSASSTRWKSKIKISLSSQAFNWHFHLFINIYLSKYNPVVFTNIREICQNVSFKPIFALLRSISQYFIAFVSIFVMQPWHCVWYRWNQKKAAHRSISFLKLYDWPALNTGRIKTASKQHLA